MDAVGHLRETITIQTSTLTRGELGGEIQTWADAFSTYSKVEFKTTGSDERLLGPQLAGRTVVQFTIRKNDREISSRQRVVYDGTIYEIDSVLPQGDRFQYILLECLQTGEQKQV